MTQELLPCTRCGANAITVDAAVKRKARGSAISDICKDCSPVVRERVSYGDMVCKPWRGDFDLDTNECMKNGKPYMPGERTCGHADCVETTHVIAEDFLLLERFDRSYITGKKLTFVEWMAKLESERFVAA